MLDIERTVLSVMGPHANENESAIFERKRADIARIGKTLWLCQSPAARPDRLQAFCVDTPCRVFFLSPASAKGARPTTSTHRMTECSADRLTWSPLPIGLGPVTGQACSSAYALVLDSLEIVSSSFDLWMYVDARNNEPVRFRLGASTLLARRGDASTHPLRPKSRIRQVLAVGCLTAPYAVWIR